MIRILLVDDHQIVREGFKKLLESEDEMTVIGDTGDGISALALIERLMPDVLVVDLMMPGLNGLEVIRQVRQRFRDMIIIVLSMHMNEAYVAEALRLGAMGYIVKESSSDELVHAIREGLAGRRFLSALLSERAVAAYVERTSDAPQDAYELLTDRERQVFQLAAEGNTNAEIAEKLTIGIRTVESHRANLMRKLNVSNHAELIHYAVQRGLIG